MRLAIRRRTAKGARWLGSRARPGAVVLLYHRVTDRAATPDKDTFGLCVSPQRFAEQMDALRRVATPISLSKLVGIARSGGDLTGRIGVSFDDGWLDNLEQAVPVLDRYRIPATLFVVTGNLGRTFWFEELAAILVRAKDIPARLQLKSGKALWRGRLEGPSAKARLRILRRSYRSMRRLRSAQLKAILQSLAQECDWSSESQALGRAMSAAELQSLAQNPLFQIGSHSHTHPVFSSLSASEQRSEITESKTQLAHLIGSTTSLFAYPHGQPSDFGRATVQAVEESGFDAAFSAQPGVIRPTESLYRLPRLWVRDWSAQEFERRVRSWLGR